MTPPTTRTWAKRGHTPVIQVRGRSQRRISIAALACYQHGACSRLLYRPQRRGDRKEARRRGFTRTDDRDLLIAAHRLLGGPRVLTWDDFNVHEDARMRAFTDPDRLARTAALLKDTLFTGDGRRGLRR
ncbi:hypothetical protein OG453_43960 [Streptomyces sp. NBC_01381]|uniref:hypothetical protein n=1 Tax=Streptomyces sp. NBC_01381 TaxID=2903845 RepID=UPI0022554B72|nr:hypothetical protein [Streptomyces sp. NBC_01381]MCX4673518.1 hypothetical protein [Streptomyces sp. NBC_01381]